MKNRKYSLVFIMLLVYDNGSFSISDDSQCRYGTKALFGFSLSIWGMSSVMELCCRRRNLLVRQVPGMEERRVPRKIHGSWYLEDLCELQGSGWILFSAAELEGK